MQVQSIRKLAILAGMAIVASLTLAQSVRADLTFNTSSSPGVGGGNGAQIVFTGTGSAASFTLVNNSSTSNFLITSTTATSPTTSTGSANGLSGNITGTYSYTAGGIVSTGVNTQTAALSGTGVLTILNPGGTNLTANVTGVDLTTTGTSGGQNATGMINLSNVLGGTGNADLVKFQALAAANGGIEALTFQFIPAQSLTALLNGIHATSFSGTLVALQPSAVPEPATVAMALTALPLLGLGAWIRRRRAQP